MNPHRFDGISKMFADRRLSRRQALRTGGGLAAGTLAAAGLAHHAAADNATPAATPAAGVPTGQFLFVQSFQKGSIEPKFGVDGTYTLTLEHGLGQTIFFSDRPERIVGASPTDQFLSGFGFPADNPPNAALVLEAGPGDEDIAVVELFNPRYDLETNTATYDIQVLRHDERLDMTFQEQPTDLAKLHPTFGAAHLFIDDCADGTVTCVSNYKPAPCSGPDGACGSFGPQGYCYSWSNPGCWPCEPYMHLNPTAKQEYAYWIDKCNNSFASCHEDGRKDYGCYVYF
jgi:hypothetical protein